jgi:hypothetical protein
LSVHFEATNRKVVFRARPEAGVTTNAPGKGGVFVAIAMVEVEVTPELKVTTNENTYSPPSTNELLMITKENTE